MFSNVHNRVCVVIWQCSSTYLRTVTRVLPNFVQKSSNQKKRLNQKCTQGQLDLTQNAVNLNRPKGRENSNTWSSILLHQLASSFSFNFMTAKNASIFPFTHSDSLQVARFPPSVITTHHLIRADRQSARVHLGVRHIDTQTLNLRQYCKHATQPD